MVLRTVSQVDGVWVAVGSAVFEAVAVGAFGSKVGVLVGVWLGAGVLVALGRGVFEGVQVG